MTKRGKLSVADKYSIQGALSDGKTVEEIAGLLDRSVKCIDTYVKGELSSIHDTIARVKVNSTPDHAHDIDDSEAPEHVVTTPEIIKAVFKRLREGGLTEQDTNHVMRAALANAQKNKRRFKNEKALYSACIRRMNAGHFMQKTTNGGKEGVAIMTGAASSRLDDSRKKKPNKVSRSARGSIYRPKTDTIE